MYLKQSTASQTRSLGPFVDDTDFKTAETGLTIANTDIRLKKNGANDAAKNSGGATHDVSGVYHLTFDATDTDTVGELYVFVAVAGALIVWARYWVLEEAVYDALFGASAAGYGTAQTGDSFARLGAPAGASVSADILVIDNLVDDLESRIGTPSNLGGGATVAANLADIEAQTDDIGAAGAGLNAVPWNAAWDAEVQSEVQDAIEANHLDHLLAATYDPAAKPGAADALLNELVESDAGVSRFTANALEQAPTGAGGDGSAFTAIPWNAAWDAEVQSEVADALNAYDPPTNAELVSEINAVQSDVAALNDVSSADVQTAVQAAIEANNLDHIAGTATGIPAIPAGTYIDQIMDDGTATYDRTTDSLQAQRDSLTTGVAGVQADTDNIQTRIPAALVSGRMDSHIGSAGAGVIDAAAAAADLGVEIAVAVWDRARASHTAQGTFGESFNGIEPFTVQTGSTTTVIETNLTEATNDHYNGRSVIFITGALARQGGTISDYDGATKRITISALTEAPANGDRAIIV